MKAHLVIASALAASATLAACQTAPSVAGTPCATGEIEAQVVAIESDSVVAIGPQGEMNVLLSYLPEMPEIGDTLRISQDYVDGTCQPRVFTPAY
ncbi:hypothetical protein [Ponticaulis sp.]|uniref:hypothetical protein n=1 Tax=Ponticaulis sp. TaxID=2020902 RepID=UPI000B6F406B|nr:hypothetical protein [Ponticaulis sp.]MAI90398.1 hypothetical protein [Ponticaulis sp.]OUY00100.1 MAG: hypothetical protein CBB65_08160 [Hyphomonadaceae bacterium TMED5]|tara:strand:- start:14448 stop:14732 length:285 start_codon:yes stop_codon:yes gene_type:complete